MQPYIDSLKQKHIQLEKNIKHASESRLKDFSVNIMKKQKLLLKEKITKLEQI